ncbi:phosphoglycerate mutase family protein [Marilutibacter spongiae]|uniref:Histidine phosphatase family protein n=1 Tax=Marilutibacter spongiae TaxID=2025720 RepID=A0A7W3TNV4_9GAMM|nr:phosphoglycerate mutase family protein [Lysobacter spongiae]MBB1061414.1 histidine phosphatase family protein [Lysobacter spongiae]
MAMTPISMTTSVRGLRAAACVFGLALAIAGCRHAPADATDAPSRFVVVRHAEKLPARSDADTDPALTAAGLVRADRLARSLRDADVVAVYATAYRRTQQTAAPTAAAHGLTVLPYEARVPAADFARQLRGRHPGGTVLVVGHSNTVPGIVAALCGCPVPPMSEAEYDHRYYVEFDAGGTPRMSDRPLSP